MPTVDVPSLIEMAVLRSLSGFFKVEHDAAGYTIGGILPPDGQPALRVERLHIGAGGIAGRFVVDGLDDKHGISAPLPGGFHLDLTRFDVTLRDGGFASSDIAGQITLPFFNPAETLDVELVLRDSGFSLILAAQQSDKKKQTPEGLVHLKYSLPLGTTLDLTIASLELSDFGGVIKLNLTGRLAIATEGLAWPVFEFKGLRIDSAGHVDIDGGWIDLPAHTSLDFFGFHVGLRRFGLSTDAAGHRILGLDGDIHLVEGIPLGGSVRGMEIDLETGALSFRGISVTFAIPGVLKLDGSIDHIHVEPTGPDDPQLKAAGLSPIVYGSSPDPPDGTKTKKIDIFAGKVDCVIIAAGGLEIAAQLIIGKFNGLSAFFLDLDVEFPTGIPIFLDVSLFGLQGLAAMNLRPDPTAPDASGQTHTWWEWYKFPTTKGVIDDKATPDYTVADKDKWLYPKAGGFALGAGATIGTSADDGYAASAAIAFVVILPGPVVTLVGKAKILSKRIGGATDDESKVGISFDALAVYDGRTEVFDLNIDAKYQIPVLIDIEAPAALHVDLKAKDWYLAMGLPPHDKRIRARVFDLFESDCYFVAGSSGVVIGSYIGYRGDYSVGPFGVGLNVFLATAAVIEWSPLVFGGGIELHGDAYVRAFGMRFSVSADALLEGRAPDPLWIHGAAHISISTPWPLPNIDFSLGLEWGGDGPPPPAPLALSHVAASLDHFGAGDRYLLLSHRSKWPAQKAGVRYDANDDMPGILAPSPRHYWESRQLDVRDKQAVLRQGPDLDPGDIEFAPVIPQDARLSINFARQTYDLADFPGGSQSIPPEPPASSKPSALLPPDDLSNLDLNPPQRRWIFKHSLRQVALYQLKDGSWKGVASQPPYEGLPPLRGSWLPAARPAGDPPGPAPESDNTALKLIPTIGPNEGPEAGLAVLPEAPALYALKTVTQIEARPLDGGFSAEEDGDAVIEFAYFQTAGGPGTVARDAVPPVPNPSTPPVFPGIQGIPAAPNPTTKLLFPELHTAYRSSGVQPVSSTYPNGGRLTDLGTYCQWFWPEDGAVAAYFGYDVSVEFNEPYVHRLYRAQGRGDVGESLHFRCVDRNNRHVVLDSLSKHVPSMPANASLVAEPFVLPLPPALGGTVDSASEAKALWPGIFLPRTRYTLDLVGGPQLFDGFCLISGTASEIQNALQEFYRDESLLTPLAGARFSTSRYATFTEHMEGAARTPRKYLLNFDPVAAVVAALSAPVEGDPNSSAAKRSVAYQAARSALASFVASYDPLGDALAPLALNTPGPSGVRARRQDVANAWRQLSEQVARLFDDLATKAGRADDLASTSAKLAPLPPDTEISYLTGVDGQTLALLLESPEPFDWRRISARLESAAGGTGAAIGMTALWNIDGTRAFLVPVQAMVMTGHTVVLVFEGDIGAEAPAITCCGEAIRETVRLLDTFTIQIDATKLLARSVSVDNSTSNPTDTPFTVSVKPGVHHIEGPGGQGVAFFSVDPAGTVNYEPAYAAVFTRREPNTLVIRGLAIVVDATNLTTPSLLVDYDTIKPRDTPFTLSVLPGPHLIENGVGGQGVAFFSVDPAGTVNYEPAYAAVFTRREPNTLVIRGLAIVVDATNLTTPSLLVDYDTIKPRDTPFTLSVLPGPHLIEGGKGVAFFSVDPAGTVAYEAALEGVFTRQEPNTLVVHGATIRIDATALSPGTPVFTLGGYGAFSTANVLTITLLPALRYDLKFGSGDVSDVFFSIEQNGMIRLESSMIDRLKVDKVDGQTELRVLSNRERRSQP